MKRTGAMPSSENTYLRCGQVAQSRIASTRIQTPEAREVAVRSAAALVSSVSPVQARSTHGEMGTLPAGVAARCRRRPPRSLHRSGYADGATYEVLSVGAGMCARSTVNVRRVFRFWSESRLLGQRA
jgi:hypothetical protein